MSERSERSSIGVRVRPNAHNFIRDLQTDLKSKRFTFWVDVRAKTTPATRDVREWARTQLQAIHASVPVTANTGKASRDMAEWRRRQAGISTKIPISADLTPANREIEVWRRTAGRDLEIRVKADVRDRGVESMRRNLEKAAKVQVTTDASKVRQEVKAELDQPGLFDIEIDASTKRAKAKMREFFADVDGKQLEFDLDIKTAKAETKVQAVDKSLGAKTISQQLDIDTKKARLDLLLLRAEEKRRKLTIDVEVKASKARQAERLLKDLQKSFGNVSIIRSLDLGPFNLGRPTGLIGTLTTLTALAGVVPAVVTAVSALSNGLISLGAAASLLPGLLGGIVATFATAAVGFNGFGGAMSAMFDVWNEGSDKMQSQAKGVASAQTNLRNSLIDEKRAQEDVGKARRDATRDLRDQNNELRSGVLNEAQAILDLQKARDRLAKGGFDNNTDRLQAVLDERKAQQNLIDVREKNNRTQADANEASAKGVEGSDKVRDALEQQARATQAVAAATQAVSDARAQGATSAFSDALAKLSPNARAAIMAISGLKGEINDFQMSIQDVIFQGVAPAIQDGFEKILPVLQPGMTAIAQGMNRNILQVFDTLTSPSGQSIIERILGGTAEAQNALTKVIDPLVRGVGTLVAAGAEHLPQVVDLVGRLADRFADFIEEADRSGDLDAFLDRGVKALSDMADIGINLVQIINDLSTAFGGDFLEDIKKITEEWHKGLASPEGQAKVKKFIQDASDLWETWRPLLEDIPGILDSVGKAAKTILDIVVPPLNILTEIAERFPGLTQALVGAFLGARVLTSVFSTVSGAFRILGGLVDKLLRGAGLLSKLPGFPGGPNVLTGPGTTPPLVAGGGGASVLGGVAAGIAIPLTAGLTMAALTPQDNSVDPGDAQKQIDDLNKGLPAGVPKYGTLEAGQFIKGSAAGGNDAGKWLDEVPIGGGGELRRAKRYAWLMSQPNVLDILNGTTKFEPPPGFMSGGFTNWGKERGNLAVLHGKEYIQPADTTAYYGVGAMQAIHEKRIPREFLQGFSEGGWFDPRDPKNQNPAGAILPNLGAHAAAGASSALNNVGSTLNGALSGGDTGTPGEAALAPFGSTGPLPGPAAGPGAPVDSAGNGSIPTINLFGIDVPLGGNPVGWPGGSPPPGLGGGPAGPNGEAPFDIRNYGIGPGPAGSTPGDWMTWTANFAADTLLKFGSALTEGALGMFGLEGLMNNPYIGFGKALGGHFASAASGNGVQDSGAGQSNADIASLLNTYDNMPLNPGGSAAPGSLPAPFDPTTGSALQPTTGGNGGLQINTLRGKAAIQARFPWAANVGGVRADALKWHPLGLALDVMTDPGHGNNDPPSPEGLAKGNQLYAWLMANKQALGIDYLMWQQKDHYNHIHVNFAPSGYPNGGGPIAAPTGLTNVPGGTNGWMSPKSASPGTSMSTEEAQDHAARSAWSAMSPQARANAIARGDYKSDGTPIPRAARPSATPAQPPSSKGWGPPSSADNPLKALFPGKVYDHGGWLGTGATTVVNNTGHPELLIPHDKLRSFAAGGLYLPQGAVPPIKPRPPLPPRGPDARKIAPRPVTPSAPSGPSRGPSRGTMPIPTPSAGPPVPGPSTPVAPPATQAPVPATQAPWTPTQQRQTSAGPGTDSFMHVHPALQKGIASTASVLGNIAATAAQVGMMALGGMGGGGGGGGLGAGALGGGMSSFIQGLFQQGGKIATNIANVGSSFLVGNITGGTTENAYGVTQMPSPPSGGTKIYDDSTTIGSIQTADLDEYYRRENIRQAQRAQGRLGSWGVRA